MPTVRENIGYTFEQGWLIYRGSLLRVARAVALIVLVAALLEVFVFNFNYFASAGYATIDLTDRITSAEEEGDEIRLTDINHVLEFSHLNTEIHNIKIDFDRDQPAQTIDVKIQFTDSAHQTYFDSTEYTVGVPLAHVSTFDEQSKYINLQTAGLVENLRLEIVGDDVSYPIMLKGLYLNAHHPFEFNGFRFVVALTVLLLGYAFRPGSVIYRIRVVENPRKSKAGILFAVFVEVVLVTVFLFYGSNLVGVATSSYNHGSWDGASIVNTFEVGGDNAQQYAELARAMAEGRLYLDEEPPDWLKAMDDPYDKGARDELQKETGEKYLFDVAYYEGHYYVYFGVVPVLLFYLPFYLLTGANFPTAIGVLVMAIAFILGCSALLDRFARYHFRSVSLGMYLLLQMPLVFCCGILYLVKFPTFYSLPIMCGLAFSVWGLYCWMRGRLSKTPCRWLFAGSLCMALVAGCRPQLLVLSLLAFPLFWRTYITKRRLLTPQGLREFGCLVAPYVLVAAGIMAYNYARFGSLTDFGANYNLTVNDMTKRGMNIGRLAPAFFTYFLQPPSMTGVFPFLQPAPFDTTYMGQTIKEVTFGGIFACFPLLWVLAFSRRILAMRARQRSTRTIMGIIIVLLVSGVLVALLDAELAGILQRYYADFSFMFLMAAVLLCFVVNEQIPLTASLHQLLLKVLLVLVFLGLLYSALLCLVPETGWYSNVYPWAYQGLLETFLFWT
ncbi:cytochrome C oxidase Cbb3 [Adlercreutzia equolifaciens]|uniref:cytochrome C oxidase Cbb3 n=1 Tax=Adlercreutzia equolifaciens TaxID=446660 RepID=UPI0023AFB023|nr:cytochrome C oxidase Cbb3 [Adlercreutzia equolifaciens]MDE8702470.1 cytochrome C oxidase Cbb3 [Adlercreutzia equolifaciens]